MKVQWSDGSFGITYTQRFAPRGRSFRSFAGRAGEIFAPDSRPFDDGIIFETQLKNLSWYDYTYSPLPYELAASIVAQITQDFSFWPRQNYYVGGLYYNYFVRPNLLSKVLIP